MRSQILSFLFFVILSLQSVQAQNTIPTFRQVVGQDSYVLVGRDPAQGGTTTIPTVLVPVTLSFEAKTTAGKPFVMMLLRTYAPSSAHPFSPLLPSPRAAPRSMEMLCCARSSPRLTIGIPCSARRR
jgi:hypothetical protein